MRRIFARLFAKELALALSKTSYHITIADMKSQVRQCLGLSTADFWSLFAYEPAEEKCKVFLCMLINLNYLQIFCKL